MANATGTGAFTMPDSERMDSTQKSVALLAGGVYVLGVLVTAIHLSRFAVFDLVLARVTYVFAGAVCAFYLLLRLSLAIAVVDLGVIRKVLSEAQQAIYHSLNQTRVFRLVDRIAGLPVLRWLLRAYTAEGVARHVVYLISLGAIALVLVMYLEVFDFSGTGLTIGVAVTFPPVVAFLMLGEVAYVLWCYFLPTFRTTRPLLAFWIVVLSFLVAADVGFYALVFHPLVKPSFGGGNVYRVPLPTANLESLKDLLGEPRAREQMMELILLHAAGESYYFTDRYERDYTSDRFDDIIQHGNILRIDRAELPAFRIGVQ